MWPHNVDLTTKCQKIVYAGLFIKSNRFLKMNPKQRKQNRKRFFLIYLCNDLNRTYLKQEPTNQLSLVIRIPTGVQGYWRNLKFKIIAITQLICRMLIDYHFWSKKFITLSLLHLNIERDSVQHFLNPSLICEINDIFLIH